MPRSRGLALSIWVCGDGYIVSSSQMSTKGRLSEKSNIPQCESRIRFWPCIGVRSISVSRGLFGKSGGIMITLGENCFGVYLFQQFVLKLIYNSHILQVINPVLLPWFSFAVALVISLLLTISIRKATIGKSLL